MNKDCMKSSRANELRYKYLRKIKEAYENFDFSDLFDDIAEDCSWSGAHGREDVIEKLISGAASMKERNYLHRCTLVRVGRPVAPLECNTAPDGSGERIGLALIYEAGEICMIDRTPHQTLFFRMDISNGGKIRSFYATLPSGDFHVIE